jgi:hypothetical protein
VWSVRAGDGGVALSYTTAEDRPAVRVFEADLSSAATPVCLTADAAPGGVAIDADGEGFVAVHPTTDFALAFTSL